MKIRISPVNHENCLHMAVRPEIYDAAFPGIMKLVPRAWWDRDKRVWLALREAGGYAGTPRHSFAMHLLEEGVVYVMYRNLSDMKAVRRPRYTPISRKKDLIKLKVRWMIWIYNLYGINLEAFPKTMAKYTPFMAYIQLLKGAITP